MIEGATINTSTEYLVPQTPQTPPHIEQTEGGRDGERERGREKERGGREREREGREGGREGEGKGIEILVGREGGREGD